MAKDEIYKKLARLIEAEVEWPEFTINEKGEHITKPNTVTVGTLLGVGKAQRAEAIDLITPTIEPLTKLYRHLRDRDVQEFREKYPNIDLSPITEYFDGKYPEQKKLDDALGKIINVEYPDEPLKAGSSELCEQLAQLPDRSVPMLKKIPDCSFDQETRQELQAICFSELRSHALEESFHALLAIGGAIRRILNPRVPLDPDTPHPMAAYFREIDVKDIREKMDKLDELILTFENFGFSHDIGPKKLSPRAAAIINASEMSWDALKKIEIELEKILPPQKRDRSPLG